MQSFSAKIQLISHSSAKEVNLTISDLLCKKKICLFLNLLFTFKYILSVFKYYFKLLQRELFFLYQTVPTLMLFTRAVKEVWYMNIYFIFKKTGRLLPQHDAFVHSMTHDWLTERIFSLFHIHTSAYKTTL